MAIIHKTINGYGPYAYRVTYEDGEHVWEYLGPVDDIDAAGEGQDGTENDNEVYEQVKGDHAIPVEDVEAAMEEKYGAYGESDIRKLRESLEVVEEAVQEDLHTWAYDELDTNHVKGNDVEIGPAHFKTSPRRGWHLDFPEIDYQLSINTDDVEEFRFGDVKRVYREAADEPYRVVVKDWYKN